MCDRFQKVSRFKHERVVEGSVDMEPESYLDNIVDVSLLYDM